MKKLPKITEEREKIYLTEKAEITENHLSDKDIESIRKIGCVISGGIGCGKTRVTQYLHIRLAEFWEKEPNEQLKLRVFDLIGNFKEYPNHKIITEKTELIATKNNLVFTLDFNTFEKRANVINAVVSAEYKKQKRLFLNDKLRNHYVYFVEEANCIFNTKEVNRGFWLDFVATARNYNMVGVYTMQRLSDSSTKIIERLSNFIFGRTLGENDRRKIFKMIPKEYRHIFDRLEKREFLCFLSNRDKPFVLKLTKHMIHALDYYFIKGERKIDNLPKA